MPSERDLLGLVAKIYESSFDPSQWSGFLSLLAPVASGTVAAIVYHDRLRGEHMVSEKVGVEPEKQRLYQEYYGANDEWFRGAAGVTYPGWVGTGQMLVPDAVLERSEFYNDYMALPDELFHLCSAQLFQEQNTLGVVSVLRARDRGPFGAEQIRLLRILLPHLQRAIQLHRNFAELRSRGQMLESALQQLSTAILFVDEKGRIQLANRAATSILAMQDSLLATRDGLRAVSTTESRELERLICSAARTGVGRGMASGGVLQISRKPPKAPLVVLAGPLRTDLSNDLGVRPAAVVFVSDPDQQWNPPASF